MTKITCSETTSSLLVGILSFSQDSFDLLSQRMFYAGLISYKQKKKSPDVPFQTRLWKQKPRWQLLKRSAMSNDGEFEMAKL